MIRARRLGRALIAINWAVAELTGFVPSKPGDLKAHAEKIQNQLALKGFKEGEGDMPKYIFACCRKMVAQSEKLTIVGSESSAPDAAPEVASIPLVDGGLEPGASAAS